MIWLFSCNNEFLTCYWSLKGVEEDAEDLASQDEYDYDDSEETREENHPVNGGKLRAFVLYPFINSIITLASSVTKAN